MPRKRNQISHFIKITKDFKKFRKNEKKKAKSFQLNIKTNAKFHLHTKPMHHFIKITMDFEKLQKNKKKNAKSFHLHIKTNAFH
jgi:hypothetical protein